MNNTIDNSQKTVTVEETTLLPHFEMLEGPDAFKSMADPEARAAFDSIQNEDELMDWLKKYDQDEYVRINSMTPEGQVLEGRVANFINTFNSDDYYRFITGENRSKEDVEMIELLSKQSPDFEGMIKNYQQHYEEMGFDNEKFRQRLNQRDALINEMKEKFSRSQNNSEN